MIGLLWFDNDQKKPLADKIRQAVDFYAKKYGGHPNVCLINPKTLSEQTPAVDGVKVNASRQVMPNHFFVGVE